ncbi:MAG: hypothetical protein U1E56_00345 [Bauldia sp.]
MIDVATGRRQAGTLAFDVAVLTGLCVAFFAGVAIIVASAPLALARFVGTTNPLVAAATVALLLLAVSGPFLREGAFRVAGRPLGLYPALALAALFGAIIVGADAVIRFPPDMNVPFPQSLAFYPAMGFAVEALFHVLPLAAIAALTRGGSGRSFFAWPAILAVALIEPTYQTAVGFADGYPAAVTVFVYAQVAAINVAELVLFRRYGFLAMLTLRWGYYAIWHIGWGAARLTLLF